MATKPLVKHIRIAGNSGESTGKSFGRAFDQMMEFIKDRQLTRMEIVGERSKWTKSHPPRRLRVVTERLVLHLPKPKDCAALLAVTLPPGPGAIATAGATADAGGETVRPDDPG